MKATIESAKLKHGLYGEYYHVTGAYGEDADEYMTYAFPDMANYDQWIDVVENIQQGFVYLVEFPNWRWKNKNKRLLNADSRFTILKKMEIA
jgi:hypothetical protein